MLPLYNTLLLPVRLATAVRAILAGRDPESRLEWAQRRGRQLPPVDPGSIWIHGASVGEATIVNRLALEIRKAASGRPVVVSALTPTGRKRLASPPDVDGAFFVPLDFPGPTREVLRALRPSVLCLVETELWPNLLEATQNAGVPVVVVNGRLSARRMKHYRRVSALYRPRLQRLARVGAQSVQDAERFVELGVPSSAVSVSGNIKYDLAVPSSVDPEGLRRTLGLAPDRPVFLAASTRSGEETTLLEAFARARQEIPNLLWIVAPRHLDRVDPIARNLEKRSVRCGRWSETPDVGELDALIVDTLGQLTTLFPLAGVAFVGGTLVPIGGHNVLEPAAAGVPVLFGPHTENMAGPADALCAADGARRVRDGSAICRAVVELLGHGDRRRAMGRNAEQVVLAHRGALARSVGLLLGELP